MKDAKNQGRIYFNDSWQFSPEFDEKMISKRWKGKTETVRIPHSVSLLPYNNFDESLYQKESVYRKTFLTEESWNDKLVLLTLEGSAHYTEVYLNGNLVASHKCGYTAFTCDLTVFLEKSGKENLLCIKVDSRENLNQPPFGHVIDYMTFGGIYRDVYLEIKSPVFIEDVFVHTKSNRYESSVTLNTEEIPNGYSIHQIVCPLGDPSGKSGVCSVVETGVSSRTTLTAAASTPVQAWTLEKPVLYLLFTRLIDSDGKVADEKTVRFGFREVRFDSTGFYLNNKKIKLTGLNRHQSFPYIGYASPKNLERDDADILKYELGLNYVRTSHYPQSRHFIDRCDEIGLLVFTELPGWQHIGNQQWQNIALDDVRDMVLQYRNHPSVFMWGVRINESADNDHLYKRTNELAHKLDQSRPTCGVRYIKNSSFLEDVYGFNDFSHNGKNAGLLPKNKVTKSEGGYLISEHNGHMFPVKAFDPEEKRLSQALRHACVLDAAFSDPEVGGVSGWCAFDYNTHKDFGSGDRICYHGVMDMFRNPKMAACVYSALEDADVTGDILEVSTNFDIGEYPAGKLGEIWVFTNADSVKVYAGEKFIKTYTRENSPYTNLKHPPILIDDTIGNSLTDEDGIKQKHSEKIKELLFAVRKYGTENIPLKYRLKFLLLKLQRIINMEKFEKLYLKYIGSWGNEGRSYRFDSYRGGKLVKSILRSPGKTSSVEVRLLRTSLVETESYDMLEVRLSAKDEHGHLLSFCNESVIVKKEGPVEIIPEGPVTLRGGMGGFFVKSAGKKGTAKITVTDWKGEESAIKIPVLKK